MDLKNKTVLITGATDGLGMLLAINLAKIGCNLIIHGRDNTKIDKLESELLSINNKILIKRVLCDFNKPDTIVSQFEKIKSLDILINNAGVWSEGNTIDILPEKIIELTNVNLLSYLLVTRTLLPTLQNSNFGQILNVSSIAGVELPQGYFHTIYTATKFGVQAFSEALEKEFGNSKLRVMGYYPGGMVTHICQKAGIDYNEVEPWMFDPQESVDAMIFMLTRNKKICIKRLDLINHLEE